ncbi:hypothetical protein [Sediminibacterium ginsengisoli]|uniref:MG2 domain-containing protein n=1 Tax=Sediminibacterium ginsengisoli TaxID=413434 RepID=A0A1T4RCJ1_9BACT|nr:hypothetical protein [Sediminibacterium ginsengisoli]SKA13536.1 hypothetical protein SAMN04488132_111110 [Sediminibacterium ginsengisoli]
MKRYVYRSGVVPALLIMVSLLGSDTAVAQQKDNIPAETVLAAYNHKVVQEKIYAHTDKDFYLAGELMWFKLYCVDAASHTVIDLSKIAYVELIDAANVPVIQAKAGLDKGDGKGSLQLPVNINSGRYRFRAYTNWMKNAGADFFFEKQVTVVNTQKSGGGVVKAPKPVYEAGFFPEGGNLVAGISSRIACKVTGPGNKGIAYSGAVINEQNDTVVRFASSRFGMSSFNFTPAAGNRYKAVIYTGNAQPLVKALPDAYAQGYVMHLSENAGIITVHVKSNKQDEEQLYLLVHTRGSVKYTAAAKVQNGQAVFTTEKNKLDAGISGFTVFNASRQPVCERLYFRKPDASASLAISMNADQAAYTERKKVTIDINTTSANSNKAADMSMAVYRLDSLQQMPETDISHYLLLASDLKGSVESPAYYFSDQADAAAAADELMLTQGWRRFKWEDVLQQRTPAFSFEPEFKGHVVTARTINTKTGAPVPFVEAYVSAPGKRTLFAPAFSDSTGRIKFELNQFYGSGELIFQTHPATDSTVRLDVASPFAVQYSAYNAASFNLPPSIAGSLLEQSIGMQSQHIYHGSQLARFTDPVNDSLPFYGKADGSYLLDNYTRFTNLEEVIREYVLMVNLRKREGKFHFVSFDVPGNAFFKDGPLVLLDGVPVFDADKMIAYDPMKIRKLETVNRKYFMGLVSFNGIINMITYKGDLNGFELDPKAVVLDYEGMQMQREFYSPVYDNPDRIDTHIPDFRNVLYWSPSVHTGDKGNTKVEFYTSDVKGKYAVILQGISSDGRTGSKILTFEVR